MITENDKSSNQVPGADNKDNFRTLHQINESTSSWLFHFCFEKRNKKGSTAETTPETFNILLSKYNINRSVLSNRTHCKLSKVC